MSYHIFVFGALYLGDEIQHFPSKLMKGGDIPRYEYKKPPISIAAGDQENAVVWIKPTGMNLLIADRILLHSVSWVDLNRNGFVEGKETVIHGQRFRCRLPQVGTKVGEPNEWNRILDITSDQNSLWNCHHTYFWGSDVAPHTTENRMIRGYPSARHLRDHYKRDFQETIGFRPVLEPLGSFGAAPNCTLDGVDFRLSKIPGTEDFCPILKPVHEDLFKGIPDGQEVKMYTVMKNGRPIHPEEEFKDETGLVLTDRYFGDEYLLPWVISNGVAIAYQPLQK